MMFHNSLKNIHSRKWLLPAVLVVVHIALALPAVISGWMWDDYTFDTPLYETDAPFGYYDIMARFNEAHLQPWHISPDFQLRFFRPLSSLSLHMDLTLGNGNPLVAHLDSLLWSVLVLLGGFAILWRVIDEQKTRRWAMIIFTLAIYHTPVSGWVSARNCAMGGAFAVWSAAFYLGWRQGQGIVAGIISAVLFLLGLLSSEVAISLPLFAFCYELSKSDDSWRVRIRYLLPSWVIALFYVITYSALGFGARNSSVYLDPFTYPGDYAALFFPKLLAVLGSIGFGIPAGMRLDPDAGRITLFAGVLCLLLLVSALLLVQKTISNDTRAKLRWLIAAIFLPMLPVFSGPASGWEFVFSNIAYAAVVAIVLPKLFETDGPMYKRLLPYSVAGLVFGGALVISPVSRGAQSGFINMTSKALIQSVNNASVSCTNGAPVYAINGDPGRTHGFPFVFAKRQNNAFAAWQHLNTPKEDITVTRPTQTRLVVESIGDKTLLSDVQQHIYRRQQDKLQEGDVFETRYLRAEVLRANNSGPTKVAYDIPGLATQGSACLLEYKDNTFTTWIPPDVGDTVTITYVPPGTL